MPTRAVLTALVLALVGCGGADGDAAPGPLVNVNGNGTYHGCLPQAERVGLGGMIVAFTANGGPPALDGSRVVDPVDEVHIDEIRLEVEPGTVAPVHQESLFQLVGLDTAFAMPVERGVPSLAGFPAGASITSRSDGALGPPRDLGWHSLVVTVRPLASVLSIHDVVVHYRVDGGPRRVGTLGMQWRIHTGRCPDPQQPGSGALPRRATELVTVFEESSSEPRTASARVPG